MVKAILICCISTVLLSTSALAESEPQQLENKNYSISYIIPIYNQLLAVKAPKGFLIDYENATDTQYIIEAVPNGETVNNWSKMFTITGYKDLATNATFKPINFIQNTANGFNKACPSTFSAKSLWKGKVSGFDAFAAVIGCGESPMTAGKTSEMALIVAIKGEKDFYTIQFAERGASSAKPVLIDTKKWMVKFEAMQPIKLCKKVKGEKEPYPSCIGK